jgi:hypothetical protein
MWSTGIARTGRLPSGFQPTRPRGCHARAQQQSEKREIPRGIDFQFEATNEVPESDIWDGEQWEVRAFVRGGSMATSGFLASETSVQATDRQQLEVEFQVALQVVGNIVKVLIPVLLVGAGAVGVFAAKTYNEGAECVSVV